LHKKRLPVWPIADLAAIPLAIGASIGRIGCFLNGCCYGLPTSLPWGIRFPESSLPFAQFEGRPLHPSQLYNVGAGLLAAAITLLLGRLFKAPGQRFWFLFGVYGVLRALVDLTRYYEPAAVLWTVRGVHVTESQVIGVAIALVSAVLFFYLGARHRRQEAARIAEEPTPADAAPAAS
jgi:phosphatidylglycerol:prolipoprotein diacylglycerol transferase